MFLWMEHLSCVPASSGLAWKQLGGVEQTGCNLCLQVAIPKQHVNHVSWQSLLFGSGGHLSLRSDWALAWRWTAAPLQLSSRVGCASSAAAQSRGCSAWRVSCPHGAKTGTKLLHLPVRYSECLSGVFSPPGEGGEDRWWFMWKRLHWSAFE